MLFSLIVPCYNPEKTIFRLFESLTRQNVSKEDLEIIVVDDSSSNLDYRKQLESFGFDLVFAETSVEIHCPGNTRREGMKHIHGDWVFFADQDDYFEDNALSKVKEYIEKNKDKTMYVISTIMRGYDPVKDKCHKEFAHKQAWLHGKWYSMKNLIIPYNINFKENLVTHEDVYFNSLVLSILYKYDVDWEYLDIYTYRWVDNPDSLTRMDNKDRGYLFENFEDYMVSAGEPYWECAKETKHPVYVNQVMMTLLHAYFYYEAASYHEGPKIYADVLDIIRTYLHRMVNELGYGLDFIVDFIYADPYKYEAVRKDCDTITGVYIPKTSLRDFVYKLGKDAKRS